MLNYNSPPGSGEEGSLSLDKREADILGDLPSRRKAGGGKVLNFSSNQWCVNQGTTAPILPAPIITAQDLSEPQDKDSIKHNENITTENEVGWGKGLVFNHSPDLKGWTKLFS